MHVSVALHKLVHKPAKRLAFVSPARRRRNATSTIATNCKKTKVSMRCSSFDSLSANRQKSLTSRFRCSSDVGRNVHVQEKPRRVRACVCGDQSEPNRNCTAMTATRLGGSPRRPPEPEGHVARFDGVPSDGRLCTRSPERSVLARAAVRR